MTYRPVKYDARREVVTRMKEYDKRWSQLEKFLRRRGATELAILVMYNEYERAEKTEWRG